MLWTLTSTCTLWHVLPSMCVHTYMCMCVHENTPPHLHTHFEEIKQAFKRLRLPICTDGYEPFLLVLVESLINSVTLRPGLSIHLKHLCVLVLGQAHINKPVEVKGQLAEVSSCFPLCESLVWNSGGKSHPACLVNGHLYYKSFWLCKTVALKGGSHKIQLKRFIQLMTMNRCSLVFMWYTRQST